MGFLILPILIAAAGCAHRGYPIRGAKLDGLPRRTEIAGVPFYSQKSHQCGPATLATVLKWSNSQISLEEITGEIYTPGRKGSLQSILVSATRSHNRLPYVIGDFTSLIQEVAAGHPVIVLQNLGLSWYPRWHYAVVIGYDIEKQIVILRSGKTFRIKREWSLFSRTWKRAGNWGLLALPPHELPESADETSFLEAVSALEAVGRHEAASLGYHAALKRWPESLGAVVGLGNSLYAMGNLEQAEKVFRDAVELCPACGDVYNNLAQVLAKQGRYSEALDAAHQAISFGGSNESVYNQTLIEITRLKEKHG
ncbi:MAG: PA2778 family cysteine peptidase [Deltaproteobacteria bacterium]|nr:PA2778 family cysteine peptidase [Deltaproteobacteria bacterium]